MRGGEFFGKSVVGEGDEDYCGAVDGLGGEEFIGIGLGSAVYDVPGCREGTVREG